MYLIGGISDADYPRLGIITFSLLKSMDILPSLLLPLLNYKSLSVPEPPIQGARTRPRFNDTTAIARIKKRCKREA